MAKVLNKIGILRGEAYLGLSGYAASSQVFPQERQREMNERHLSKGKLGRKRGKLRQEVSVATKSWKKQILLRDLRMTTALP